MDEPTNHIDIEGQEKFENSLADEGHTCIYVSHDRYMVNHVATRYFQKDKSKQIKQVYLVENAPKMLEYIYANQKYHIIRQDFSKKEFDLQRKFDCITCLWNVMGHVERDNVLTALNNMAKHLSPSGFAIIDINNRKNIKQYGIHAIKNWFRDLFFYDYAAGDIIFDINITGNKIKSQVHLFSKTEFDKLIEKSNLQIQKCYYINYNTGKKEYFSFCGQLCYILRRKI